MRRFLLINGLVALVVAATVGVVTGGPAYAAKTATFQCSGDIGGQTINGSVVALAGCYTSTPAHITGNLTTAPGGNLVFFAGTVDGSVLIKDASPFGGEFGAQICATTIGGNLTIEKNAAKVYIEYGCDISVAPNTVKGSVLVENNSAQVDMTRSTFNQDVTIRHNSGEVDLDLDDIGGSVSATSNTGGGIIADNTISGNMTATHNNPTYTVVNKSVAGTCNNEGTTTC